MKAVLVAGVFALAVGVVGCGGGGGGAVAPVATVNAPAPTEPTPTGQPSAGQPQAVASNSTFDLDTIIKTVLMGSSDVTLTAKAENGDAYTLREKRSPAGTATLAGFGDVPDGDYRVFTHGTAVTMNGKPVKVDWGSHQEDWFLTGFYYTDSPFKIAGAFENMHVKVTFAEFYAPPTTAKVGDFGWLTVTSKELVDGGTEEGVTEWSLEADTATTAWFCIIERTRVTRGSQVTLSGVEAKECSKVTPSGTVQGFTVDIYQEGLGNPLKFR